MRGGALKPLARVSGLAAELSHAQALRKRRLLHHLRRDRLVHRGVGVDAVSAADHSGRSQERVPGEPDARLPAALIGRQQRIRVALAGERAGGIAATTGAAGETRA